MARKRMFDLEIINQDSFLDLPMEAKAIYFLLGMEADDDGFVSPKKILRLYGGTEDSIKILAAKNYIIPFKSGVVVITDWNNNNWLDSRRKKDTIYQEEKQMLVINQNTQKYELNSCLANAKQMLRENRIEENRIEENRIEENKKVSKKKSFDALIDNYTNCEELKYELKNHLATRKSKKATLTNRAIELSLKKLDELTKNIPVNEQEQEKIKIVQQSIERGWIGFFEIPENKKQNQKQDGWDFIDEEYNKVKERMCVND